MRNVFKSSCKSKWWKAMSMQLVSFIWSTHIKRIVDDFVSAFHVAAKHVDASFLINRSHINEGFESNAFVSRLIIYGAKRNKSQLTVTAPYKVCNHIGWSQKVEATKRISINCNSAMRVNSRLYENKNLLVDNRASFQDDFRQEREGTTVPAGFLGWTSAGPHSMPAKWIERKPSCWTCQRDVWRWFRPLVRDNSRASTQTAPSTRAFSSCYSHRHRRRN